MADPTVGELTNIRPEAASNPIAVLDSSRTVQQLNQSAQFNAELKQRRYAESLSGLKDLYQDIGKIQAMDILEEDRPLLEQKNAQILKDIGDDPQALFGSRGGAKFAKVQKDLGEYRALATQSKQDNLAYTFNKQYLQHDADLQTPENIAKVDNYPKQKLGSRQFQLLEMEPGFDVDKAAQNVKNFVGKKYGETTTDQGFIVTKSGMEYSRDAYLKAWNTAYDGNPKIQKWATWRFNKIKDNPAEIGAYADPDTGEIPKNPKEFYTNAGKVAWPGGLQDIRSENPEKRVANPYDLLNIKQAFQQHMADKKQNFEQANIAMRAKLGNTDLGGNTEYLIRDYSSLYSGAGDFYEVTKNDGKVEKGVEIPMPDFAKKLENYVTTSTKEGVFTDPVIKTVIDKGTPDKTLLLRDGTVHVEWFDKDKDGKITKVRKEDIPTETWLKVGAATVPAKFRPSAINAARSYFQKHKNYVLGEMKRISEGGDLQEAPTESKQDTFTIKGKPWTRKQLNERGYSDEKIDQLIKEGKLK